MPGRDTPSPPLSWGRSTVSTACPLDGQDACSLSVTVERGRVVKIAGSPLHPSIAGAIDDKVRRFDRRLYGPDRVQHPLLRTGPRGSGQFARVPWDEALDLLVDRLNEARATFGGDSILPYHSGRSNGLLTDNLEDARFFRRLGASQLTGPTGAASTALLDETMPGVAYEDYAAARLIVIWGSNPSTSGAHLIPYVQQAREQGARLVVIDPRATPLARTADLYLPVRPGTDVVVALAVINELFTRGWADEAFLAAHADGVDRLRAAAAAWPIPGAAAEAGLDPAALARFAEWYGTTSPAVIRCGAGQARNRNGVASTRAILALPAVGGKFGVRGGGYTFSNAGAWGISQESLIDQPAPSTRAVNRYQLGRALTTLGDPSVKVLFVYNANPLATAPDQQAIRRGLMREDLFTVVHEQVLTDTALHADLVLPATTFLEHYDIARGDGAYHLHLVQPAIAPVGESRSNHDLFRDLSVRLGLGDDDALGEAGLLMEAIARMPGNLGTALMAGERAEPPTGPRPIQFVDVHPSTAGGRLQLSPAASAAESEAGDAYHLDPATEQYPLALISPSSERTIASTLGEQRPSIAKVKVHPDDAHSRAIADGDPVRIFNNLGDVHCNATITPEVRPGTLALPLGLWARSTYNGQTGTALVPDTLTAPDGNACPNDARVQLELLGRH
ncbi:MAG: hypothetical protein ABS36_07220 [Acidobacteria bacterium SCN 69-37]|nr:MAG: hypothetical protein ABS36_07220 [Acidobacteria bacterium SCN 69-37]